jgi:hypothetical protein
MVLRIEKTTDGHSTVIRLSGRLQSEHAPEVSKQMQDSTDRIVLDLEEVTLVDLDIVRFLASREAAGIELLHCPLYVREWISREKGRDHAVQAGPPTAGNRWEEEV